MGAGRGLGAVVSVLATCFAGHSALARGSLPSRIGDCARTRIVELSHRLEDGVTRKPVIDSGSAVTFANRLSQVSYEELAAVHHSRRGDPVLICLVLIPRDCPRGDNAARLTRPPICARWSPGPCRTPSTPAAALERNPAMPSNPEDKKALDALRQEIDLSLNDPRPSIPAERVFASLRLRHAKQQPHGDR